MSVPMFPVATELASRVSFLGTSAVSTVGCLPKIYKMQLGHEFSLTCHGFIILFPGLWVYILKVFSSALYVHLIRMC